MIQLKTVDAHAGGEPLRLVVEGFPSPRGRTMADKREWVKRHADHLRRTLLLEPRGHIDMYGALLTEPTTPGSHAGVLFMHGTGYSAMSGHGIIAVTTIALERGLLMPGGDGAAIVYDSLAGTIRARATFGPGEPGEQRPLRVSSVRFLNVPSFVLRGGLVVKVGGRHVRVDVAFGGEFFAIVDAEAVGLPLDGDHLPELRRVGVDIAQAVSAAERIVHPLDAELRGIDGAIFTGPPRSDGADLRNVTVFGDGQVDRSPSGAGTAAVMAVIDAMGLLAPDRPFVHESVIDTRVSGRLAGRTTVGEHDAIVAEIEGTAWITGEHTFVVRDDDPLGTGFCV